MSNESKPYFNFGGAVGPDGKERKVYLDDVLGADIRPELFAVLDDFKEPEKMLKNPDPACKYVWKVYERKNGLRVDAHRYNQLVQGISNGWYRIVQTDELKDDVDAPYSVVDLFGEASPSNQNSVVIKGLILVEVRPDIVNRQYRQPLLQAMLRSKPDISKIVLNDTQRRIEAAGYSPDQVQMTIEETDKTEV